MQLDASSWEPLDDAPGGVGTLVHWVWATSVQSAVFRQHDEYSQGANIQNALLKTVFGQHPDLVSEWVDLVTCMQQQVFPINIDRSNASVPEYNSEGYLNTTGKSHPATVRGL